MQHFQPPQACSWVQIKEVLLSCSALTIGLEGLNLLDVGQAGQAVMEHVQQGVQDGIKETLPTTIHHDI